MTKFTRFSVSVGAAAIAVGLASPAFAGTVEGIVIDASETIALQSAQVRIVELDRVATSDRDGSFVFGDVPAGTYTLEVRYVGATPVTQTIDVSETGTAQTTIRMGGDDAREILVIGQAANQASALSRKRESDTVSDVLTRDAIGQFPDQNVAESLRRLPGINVLDDQGEGRFVSVRGLDPELNSTSLNGVRLPAPEKDVRSVALDVVSSDLIESIEVKKSLTPDMDADTIGASVEIHTTSAFDRRKDLIAANIEGSYNDYSGKVTPKGSLDFAVRAAEDVGISGGVSYYERDFETDNVETGEFWATKNGLDYNEEIQFRDYDVQRKRINANLGFDFRVSDSTNAYVKGTWAQFDDHEYRRRTTMIFDGDPISGDATSAVFTDDTSVDGGDRIEIRRDIKDRFERQRIRTVVLGSDTDTGEWKFNWSASYAKSSEFEDFSLDPTRFRARFEDDGVSVAWDYSNARIPSYTLLSGAELVNDPTEYGFNRIELTNLSDSQDEEWALKADLAHTSFLDGGEFTVQGGAKARWRDKSYDFNLIYYGDFAGDYTLADVLGSPTYRIGDIGPVASKSAPADFYLSNTSSFEVDDYETALGSAVDDYSVSEDILAAYLLGRWESSAVRVIAGVRMERTDNTLNGNLVQDLEPDVIVSPVSYDRSYTDWLPSINVRYETASDLVMRFAAYKSLVRPKLSKLAPRYNINEDNEAEFGNPDLQPYRAWNFDAGVEYYFSGNGAISLAGFYKKIDNFIVDGFFDAGAAPYNGVFRGVAFSEASIPLNGDSADVAGIEASYSQAFTMLPAPLDGLLLQANYTYTWSEGTLFDGRSVPLPASSSNTFNLVLGYESGPFEFRAAGTYRDKYLDELGGSADEDRYVQDHFQVDLSAKFAVTENIRLFAEWVNVNNAKYFAYQNYNSSQRLLQFEEYGSTFKFGAKVNF